MGPTSSSTADPQLLVSDRVEPSFVVGSTREEIARCVGVSGPRQRGGHFVAWTFWRIRWSFTKRHDGLSGPPSVGVDVIMRLPRWIPVGASAELAAAWRSFEEGVLAHEAGHRAIAVRTGRAIFEALRSSESMGEEIIREGVEAILRGAHESECQYDLETCHGAIDPRLRWLGQIAP